MANHRLRHMAQLLALSTLAACASGPRSSSPDIAVSPSSGATYSLRARRVAVPDLIMFVSGNARGRSMVIGPEVGGVLSLDVDRRSVLEIEGEVVRASGAGSLAMGNTVLIGGPARLAAATSHPSRPLLAGRAYKGRRVTLTFTRAPITNTLRVLALASECAFEMTEDIEGRISIGAYEAPWDEILDALAVSSELTTQNVNGIIRVSRRGDSSPHFFPLGRKFVDDPGVLRTEREQGRCAANLDRYDPSQLHLDAVMSGPPPLPVAFVRYPSGTHAILRKGSCTGSWGGVVSRVEHDRIAYTEHQLGADGTEALVERALMLEGD